MQVYYTPRPFVLVSPHPHVAFLCRLRGGAWGGGIELAVLARGLVSVGKFSEEVFVNRNLYIKDPIIEVI